MKNAVFLIGIFWAAVIQPLAAQQIEAIKAVQLAEKFHAQQGVVVVNFWSTWCKPCVEEIPHFLEVYDSLKDSGVQLWLVSQDTRDIFNSGKLKAYISKRKGWDRARLFWFNETNADYYCPLINKEWSGVIPATLILNNKNGYSKFIEESMTAEKLVAEIRKAM